MSVEFKDHSNEVLAKLNGNKLRALKAIGEAAVEVTNDYMQSKYGKPIYITGDLMRSISSNVRLNDEAVDIGSNLNYAEWVHNGTRRMDARPFLKDAITENTDIWEEVAAEHLGEGFDGIKVSGIKLG